MTASEKFFLSFVLVVAYCCVASCTMRVFPTLNHPRASQEIDFTKPPAEIPDQYHALPPKS